jgi:uncharacterized membrane protein YuzA (DUF378 family)
MVTYLSLLFTSYATEYVENIYGTICSDIIYFIIGSSSQYEAFLYTHVYTEHNICMCAYKFKEGSIGTQKHI